MYRVSYKCTFGWGPRMRGTGKQQASTVRNTDCPAGFSVHLCKLKDDAGREYYNFEVSKQNTFHNHTMTEKIWRYMAENRKVTDPVLVQRVEELQEAGASVKKITQYLRKQSGYFELCFRQGLWQRFGRDL